MNETELLFYQMSLNEIARKTGDAYVPLEKLKKGSELKDPVEKRSIDNAIKAGEIIQKGLDATKKGQFLKQYYYLVEPFVGKKEDILFFEKAEKITGFLKKLKNNNISSKTLSNEEYKESMEFLNTIGQKYTKLSQSISATQKGYL